jgi:hypothetical protein
MIDIRLNDKCPTCGKPVDLTIHFFKGKIKFLEVRCINCRSQHRFDEFTEWAAPKATDNTEKSALDKWNELSGR